METKQLKQAITLLVNEKQNTLPVIDNVFVDKGDVVMTDLDIRLTVKNFFEQKFSTLVNAKKLINFLQLARDPICFEEGGVNNSFTDLNGRVSLGKADKIEEFPQPSVPKKSGEKIKIGMKDIEKYFTAVKFCADDKLRPVMNCVWHGDHIVASDAHRMYFVPAHTVINDPQVSYLKNPILIPRKVVKLLQIYPGEYNAIREDNCKNILFVSKEVDISFREVEGNYPNWKAVVPEKFNYEIHTCLQKFVKAIDYVRPYMNKYSEIIHLGISENSIKVSSQDLDFNTSAETQIRCTVKMINDSPIPFQIGFNYSFMKEICNILDDDELVIKIINPNKATVFGGLLLMPMMIMDH